jgi:hypothetical protein
VRVGGELLNGCVNLSCQSMLYTETGSRDNNRAYAGLVSESRAVTRAQSPLCAIPMKRRTGIWAASALDELLTGG